MRILQISDTHLTNRLSHFKENLDTFERWLVAQDVDLVIHTGDVAMDGAGTVADLEVGAAWLAGINVPVLAVPGNHDVGDTAAIKPSQTVNHTRLEAWCDRIGPDRWSVEAGPWRLIGLNAMLFGTGHPEEQRQYEWLADAVSHTGPIALFLHKPLFIEDPREGPRGYWTVNPEPRERLLDIMNQGDIRLIGSGHLHIQRIAQFGPTQHIWGPSAAFVCGDSQEDLGGERLLGAVVYELSARGFTSRFVRPSGLVEHLIDDVISEVYPTS